ncbi:NAD(P)-dependent glycerol-1-phosphate dehydrogenase [Candidatus Bathyarchaeota archaeon]|nr:MAG: NAD(P)-dependent glycerol-1-phosphate dehydrogenase [Candidatus Bathyarchaeota archaeon]
MHRMELPREVIVGENTLDLVAEVTRKLGFKRKVFIVSGPKTFEIAGRKVKEILEDAGITIEYSLVNSPTVKEVSLVERQIKKAKPEVVFGVGGGTKIDVAKLSSARVGVPFISVPTTASHDGIASPVASIKGLSKPYSVMAQSPMAIIADTEVIIKADYRFIASGCGDVIAKLTAVRDWKLAHMVKKEYYGEYAASLALMSAKLIVRNADLIKPGDNEGLRILLEALISCGVAMSIAGSSRPCSGSEHLFSHTLDLIDSQHAMHGEQCGVGTIIMGYLHRINWKKVKETLEKVGAPTTAEELGVKPEKIVEAIVRAKDVRPERYTILNEKQLDVKSAEKIAKTTGIID